MQGYLLRALSLSNQTFYNYIFPIVLHEDWFHQGMALVLGESKYIYIIKWRNETNLAYLGPVVQN